MSGSLLWGPSGCKAGLLFPGWHGPREHEGLWFVHPGLYLKTVNYQKKCSAWRKISNIDIEIWFVYLNKKNFIDSQRKGQKNGFLLSEIVDQPGLDVFGQVYNQWKNKECVCPNCSRSIAASRFAPHLEKCLGMGRNSSRIANRR